MKTLKTLAVSIPLAVSILFAGQAMAADDNRVMLNFVNSDIDSTVKAVGLITGKNFVLDPRVKGTVNVVSSSPVPRAEVYPILLSALRLQGFAVVETPGAIKVVPEADAKQNIGATVDKKLNIGGDRIVTQVYPLHNESAAQLVPILRPLITPNNSIAAYPNANILVITDYADNVKRLDQIIANIDQPMDADLVTIPLKTASALDVSQMLAKLMPEITVAGSGALAPATLGDGIRKTVVIPDTRSNSLIVRGDNGAHTAQIKRIAESLDSQSTPGGNIHVIYLKNADATRLAATLKAILTGGDVPQSVTTPLSSTPISGTGNSSATPTTAQPSLSSSGSSTASQGVAVQADPTTNALIITAPDNVYNNLRAVVDKLDARRAQVYVEAMIAEVSLDKLGQFGIQWLVGGTSNNVSVVGASATGDSTAGTNIVDIAKGIASKNYTLPGGLTLGVLNGSLTGSDKPSLGVLANALESTGNGNVLSTPNILTLDNEEAKILVGQNLPFVSGTQSSTGSNPNPFTTVDRKDVGITLRVKPQVSEGGAITMQVYQEVSSVDATVNTQGAGLATKKRSIESKVLVDDGQVIVLGGLIENDLSQTFNKVPILGDIPGLGNLFRYESREHKRTNLMVFLRPVILRDGQSAAALSNDRYRMLQDAERDYQPAQRTLLPDLPANILPEVDLRKPATKLPLDAYDKSGNAAGATPASAAEPAGK
ncbi:MAG: type II secretion system secretin GspD [Burkholderiales bacterium]|nr:type II secretion system secretin GspD [Burkholderiales bacterium]